MKKVLLFLMAVMAFAGMSVAQDVYTSGLRIGTNGNNAVVYRNNSLLYEIQASTTYYYESPDVLYANGDVYWIKNCIRASDDEYHYGDVMKNGSTYLSNPAGNKTNIEALTSFESSIYATGRIEQNGVKTAVVWRNNNTTPLFVLGDGVYKSSAYDIAMMNDENNNGWVAITVGTQHTSDYYYRGVVWKGNSELYDLGMDFTPKAVAVYGNDIYTVGNYSSIFFGGHTIQVFKNESLLYTIDDASCLDVSVDAGDVYVSGKEGSYLKVWKNGQELYSINSSGSSYLLSIEAGSWGVIYSGYLNSNGQIWKNGSTYGSSFNNTYLYGMDVVAECDGPDIRTLPYTENFENITTDWECWGKFDNGANYGNLSFWHRQSVSGGMSAVHEYQDDHNQEGWLVSPALFLQPGRDHASLTFKTAEQYPTSYTYEGVWISTTGNTPSAFTTQLWTQSGASASNSWKTVSVNLDDYMGQVVYIGFKYSGTDGHTWWIDDISIDEDWQQCPVKNVPYSESFDSDLDYCWYIIDNDHSGGGKYWKYNSTNHCVYHPWGQQNVQQEGWLFSPKINLPSGHDYALTFRQKNNSSGSNMHNSVWIALDETGDPDPSDYTQIWEASNYPNSWTEESIPLSAYAGHTINIAFKYEGTYAHEWSIDDVAVTESIAQYTIAVNANNNAWGSVTGGGPYNAGESCTITATPASGYQFQSWKKNGTVVSTSPSYTFTVTESAIYTAYFGEIPINYYTIDTEVNPADAGSVSGGGTFQEGSSITLMATANNGYEFDHWQDGNTQNPRTITVTGDATYTAYFNQLQYTINVYANPTNGGTVTGTGTYTYGQTVTLTATPNEGYEFAGWHDGNTDNPRSITVTGNASYTAIFNEVGATYYSVNTSVSPNNAGVVTGGGTFEEGTVIVLEAVANPGYTFSHWNDGITSNPRTVTVTGNMSFTAYFNQNSYTITVVANPINAGLVTGGGSYHYGDYATLYATAYSGYDFVGWSDGSSENPHQVLVTGNATYTATFSQAGATYYNVSTSVSPANAGNVTGAGTYPEGTNVTLTATANEGYTFSHWNDGITTNPRTITVNNNMSFTAFFNTSEYTISVNANPSAGGTVTGGGTYPYGATVILTATPSSGYSFMQWGDGNMNNPRTITVTGNATYTALFLNAGGEVFTLTVTSNNLFLGSTYGSGTYPTGSAVEIRAIPSLQGRFVKWDDGNTDNPRTVIVDRDMEIKAEFVVSQDFTITVESADPEKGMAYGGGTFQEGTDIQISAVAFEGNVFTSWHDGNTDNPRTITVTGDATYIAKFSSNNVSTYNLTLICNTSEGTVSGGGTYVAGSEAMIGAFPHDGYAFDKWSDENTQNPRIIVMDSDKTLVAFFKGTGVDENGQANLTLFPNPAKHSIRIEGLEANSELRIFNVLGELVRVVNAGPDDDIAVGDLALGLYLVRIGNASLRFVKE